MKNLFFICCVTFISCLNSSAEKDTCKYSLQEYLELDSLTISPLISKYGDIEQCADERNNKSFGGIYAFANSGEYYIYRFYLDSNRYTYEESTKDSIQIPNNPIVHYRIGIDKSGVSYISIFYFVLNKEISNLVIVNKKGEKKKLGHGKTNGLSNIDVSNIFFPGYSVDEVKSFQIYIEGDVLLCNGKKSHFKEPLIWNKEEAEKYAKQQNKLR